MKYTALVDGQTVEIEFERKSDSTIEAHISGRTYVLQATPVAPGIYWFNWQNRSIEVAMTRAVDGYAASVGEHRLSIEIVDARTARKKAAQHAHEGLVELKAPMPGKIVKVLAQEGTEVKANQGVVVMEAMKMQNEIKSPKPGIVRKINVTEGVAVNAGQILATVE
jgi:biotin carboxyl carrier protein